MTRIRNSDPADPETRPSEDQIHDAIVGLVDTMTLDELCVMLFALRVYVMLQPAAKATLLGTLAVPLGLTRVISHDVVPVSELMDGMKAALAAARESGGAA
jgi:hypothetical protein